MSRTWKITAEVTFEGPGPRNDREAREWAEHWLENGQADVDGVTVKNMTPPPELPGQRKLFDE